MKKRVPTVLSGIAVALTLDWSAAATEIATPNPSPDALSLKVFAPVISDQFTPVPIEQVKLTGLLGKHIDSVPGRLFNGQRETYLNVFEHPTDTNIWQAEHIGKWLESACNQMAYTHDAKLRALVDKTVARLIELQQPDGWLGSYAPEYRFHKYDWKANVDKKYEPFYNGPFYDIWCHYLTMGGLMRYYEVTGSKPALAAVRKIADLIIATFGEGKQDLMLINHDHGFGPGVGVFPFSKLYLLTGDSRYRDFANYITTQYGRQGKVPIQMSATAKDGYPFPDWAQIKHCEFELCLAGMCQLYRGTGEPQFFVTPHNLYTGYFAPLNETICLRGFKSPPPGMRVPDTYYGFLETCDIVPMLRWYVEMARITGDSQYLDALEWNLYNALLSRDLPDGSVWPGLDVPQTNIFHCCYSMLVVGLSYIPNWTYFTTTNGIMVNLYESSVLSTRVADVPVKFEQTTEYPLDGTVKLKIKPEHPATFDLSLRIPKWCQGARVQVNGKPVEGVLPVPGTTYKIGRQWKRGDTVELVFDMPGHAVRREFAKYSGQPVMTLERGPLLLAATAKLNPGVKLETINPAIAANGSIHLQAQAKLKAINASSARFRADTTPAADSPVKRGKKSTMFYLAPYAYSGVSDKSVPPPKEGVFNVYSEDGAGPDVRVEFPIKGRQTANN
ncbi:MAG: beta-L-arabinofuranosidase domain-containing protein [Verrucomicrobiota bacterium]